MIWIDHGSNFLRVNKIAKAVASGNIPLFIAFVFLYQHPIINLSSRELGKQYCASQSNFLTKNDGFKERVIVGWLCFTEGEKRLWRPLRAS